MNREQDLESILDTIIKAEFRHKLSSWVQSSTSDEKKGLIIISSIFKHKGKKKFRYRSSTSKSSRSVLSTAEQLKARNLKSSYETEYGATTENKKAEVLQYRTLEDLPCSQILNSVTLMFLENWLKLKDDRDYQDLILKCLRSLTGLAFSNNWKLTESKKQFTWKDPARNFTNHRTDHVNLSIRIGSSSVPRPWVRPKTPEAVDTKIRVQPLSKEDLMKRKQQLVKGTGIFGRGISTPGSITSHYQDTYITHFNKYEKPPHKDFNTSISLGRICPTSDG